MINRSFQSLLPFILATLGCFLVLVAVDLPLFEWHISKLVKDFPPSYEVRVVPSPWIAYLGDSFDDSRYIFRNISIEKSGLMCLGGEFDFTASRSAKDQAFERALHINVTKLLWLLKWGYVEIGLSVIYIWLFIMWYEHRLGFVRALIFTAIAGFIFLLVSQAARILAGPFRFSPGIAEDFGFLDCVGKITFAAALLKVHYETLVVLFIGSLLEFAGIVVIVYQIRKVIIQRKESASLAVG